MPLLLICMYISQYHIPTPKYYKTTNHPVQIFRSKGAYIVRFPWGFWIFLFYLESCFSAAKVWIAFKFIF